jgi:hypothetical protein
MPSESCVLVHVDGVLTMRVIDKGVYSVKMVEG